MNVCQHMSGLGWNRTYIDGIYTVRSMIKFKEDTKHAGLERQLPQNMASFDMILMIKD